MEPKFIIVKAGMFVDNESEPCYKIAEHKPRGCGDFPVYNPITPPLTKLEAHVKMHELKEAST